MITRLCRWWLRRQGFTVVKGSLFVGSPIAINGNDSNWVGYENPRRLRIIAVDNENPYHGYAVEERNDNEPHRNDV